MIREYKHCGFAVAVYCANVGGSLRMFVCVQELLYTRAHDSLLVSGSSGFDRSLRGRGFGYVWWICDSIFVDLRIIS